MKKPKGGDSVTFFFHSADDKRSFLGQLSDGWGENFVYLDWQKGDLYDADEVVVQLIESSDT